MRRFLVGPWILAIIFSLSTAVLGHRTNDLQQQLDEQRAQTVEAQKLAVHLRGELGAANAVLKYERTLPRTWAPVAPSVPSKASRSRSTATPKGDGTGALNWLALADCESSSNPRAVSPNGLYFGLYQFDAQTWLSVGGTGNPANATPAEQTHRAQLLYAARGRRPWPVCGARL